MFLFIYLQVVSLELNNLKFKLFLTVNNCILFILFPSQLQKVIAMYFLNEN